MEETLRSENVILAGRKRVDAYAFAVVAQFNVLMRS